MNNKMLNVPYCPLCGNKDANLIERIDAKSLINIYKKKIEIDIKKYITSDIDYYHCNICSLGFLRDSLKCLKSNGFLIIAVPNKRGVAGLLPNIFLDLPPHHASHWTEDSLAYLKQLFNVEIVTINKERVAPQHIIAARKYLILQALAPKALAKNKLINNSLLFGLLNVISSILARILSINTNTLYGHTIIAVFKKIAD